MFQLHVVQGPYVTAGGGSVRMAVPTGVRRLAVLVALHGPLRRQRAAALLWPTATTSRGAGNLRSALWRLRTSGPDLIADVDGRLRLTSQVTVDVWALEPPTGPPTTQLGDPLPFLTDALNVLPGWYDDWLTADRERIRGLALHGLDVLSNGLRHAGRSAEAIEAALLAVGCDPLRESSQIALVRAHLGEGNHVEARRAYARYHRQLSTEVGIEPSPEFTRMINSSG